MYKNLIVAAFLLLIGFACKQQATKEAEEQATRDRKLIEAYLQENNISAENIGDGIYYQRLQNGTGTLSPSVNDTVNVRMVGRVMYGKIIEDNRSQTNLANILLSRRETWWRSGVIKMKKGERGVFFIPSILGYGGQGFTLNRSGNVVTLVPPNSILIYDIELVDIKLAK